jgi:hypothetical protein
MRRSRLSTFTSAAMGAVALTAIHEFARRRLPDAPRMDVLGMRALRRIVPDADTQPRGQLRTWALAGDLLANSLYYSLIPAETAAATWHRAAVLGAAAGAGALLLPETLGLGEPPHVHTPANQWMTVGWYVAGALVTAALSTRFTSDGVIHNGNRRHKPGLRRRSEAAF